jgi:hypothetical protein
VQVLLVRSAALPALHTNGDALRKRPVTSTFLIVLAANKGKNHRKGLLYVDRRYEVQLAAG